MESIFGKMLTIVGSRLWLSVCSMLASSCSCNYEKIFKIKV